MSDPTLIERIEVRILFLEADGFPCSELRLLRRALAELKAMNKDAERYRKLRDVEFDHMTWECLRTCSTNALPTIIDDYQTDAARSKQHG